MSPKQHRTKWHQSLGYIGPCDGEPWPTKADAMSTCQGFTQDKLILYRFGSFLICVAMLIFWWKRGGLNRILVGLVIPMFAVMVWGSQGPFPTRLGLSAWNLISSIIFITVSPGSAIICCLAVEITQFGVPSLLRFIEKRTARPENDYSVDDVEKKTLSDQGIQSND